VHNFAKDILQSMKNANSFRIFAEDSFRNQNNALNSDLASTICAIRNIVRELQEHLNISDIYEFSDSDHNGADLDDLFPDIKKRLPGNKSAHSSLNETALLVSPACSSLMGGLESTDKEREGPQAPDDQCEVLAQPILPNDDEETSATDAGAALIAKYAHLDKTGAMALDSEVAHKTNVPAVDLLAMMALVNRNTNKLAVRD
jgi:hypothetical protein